MGVTGLWKLIEQSGKPVPVETLENKILAVDISIWLHQVVKGFQDADGARLENAHLLGLFHRLCKLMYYRVKPVFVFDGGVPILKQETIAKRAKAKNKYHKEAEKLQQILLENLVKENIVQQALGPNAGLLFSPPKSKRLRDDTDDDSNDIFKLPAIEKLSDEDNNLDASMTDLNEDDSNSHYQHRYLQNLRQINVKSSYFQSLPADIRYEILSDMKEMRKESSWGRLHELPAESQTFSNFQMSRLLKRRQVQVELEVAQNEIGGKSITLAELERLLSEDGIVDPDIAKDRIVSNEHVRYLHVCDVKKAMENEAKQIEKNAIKSTIKDEIQPSTEEDYALQKAIQLSLGSIKEDEDESMNESADYEIKMTEQQKQILSKTTKSLARNYMIEYADMNDSQISNLIKPNEESIGNSIQQTEEKESFVSQSILEIKRPKSPALSISSSKDDEMEEVSSDADSDFVDVPDISFEDDMGQFMVDAQRPLPKPFLMNESPIPNQRNNVNLIDVKKNEVKLEVVINLNDKLNIEDDIFSDVFNVESKFDPSVVTSTIVKQSTEISGNSEEIIETSEETIEIKEKAIEISEESEPSSSRHISNGQDLIEVEIKPDERSMNGIENLPKNNMNDILSELDKEMENVKEADFTDILEFAKAENTSPNKILTEISSNVSVTLNDVNKDIKIDVPSTLKEPLNEAISSLPSTSTATEDQIVAATKKILQKNKTEDELNDMAIQLNADRHELLIERNKRERLGVSITEQMTLDCMELMKLFGVPYIVAPMEAEAQCAFLNQINLTDGTITDDSDIWLFGGQTVYKNFFDQNKVVMEFKLDNIKKLYHIDRAAMIQLSFLVGSDYTPGISGVGTVTAMEILSLFTSNKDAGPTEINAVLSGLRKFREWWQTKNTTARTAALRKKLKNISLSDDFPSSRVVEAYLFPSVDANDEKFAWGRPQVDKIKEFAKVKFGWTGRKIDEVLIPVLRKLDEKKSQAPIKNYFKVTSIESRQELKVSDRMRKAIDRFSADGKEPELIENWNEIKERNTRCRKNKKKVENIELNDADKAGPTCSSSATTSGDSIDPVAALNSVIRIPLAKPKTKVKKSKAKADADIELDEALVPIKKVRLPETNMPIPQREKDLQQLELNKEKAVKLFKNLKKK